MAEYKVTSTGFIDGQLRSPGDGKGNVTITPKPKKCPSWLEEVKPETASQKKAREAKQKANAEKVKEDQKAKDEISFTDGHNGSGAVETL